MKISQIYFIAFILVTGIGSVFSYYSGTALAKISLSGADYIYGLRIAILLIFGLAAIRLLNMAILDYGKNRTRVDEKSIVKVVSLFGYVVIFLLFMLILDVNVTGVLVGAGFLGIVLGLAAQTTLGNLFAGVSMMASKPFANGDRVTFSTWQYGLLPPSHSHPMMLPGYTGIIEEVGLMYTRVKTEEGASVFVPNGVLNQALIINYSVSGKINVNIRVELKNSFGFNRFRDGVIKGIRNNRKLSGIVNKEISIRITDMGISNYGISISVYVPVENEKYVQAEFAEIAKRVISRSR